HACKEFRCTLQEFCISPDLECDEVNHCGDNSDEAATCPLTHQTHGSKNGTTGAGASYNTSLAGPAHQYSGVSATLPRLQSSAVAGPVTGANYYQQQQSATLQRTTTAPSHPRDNTNGPRVSFLPSGNPPLPVASGRGYCSRGAQGNLTTYLDGSEDPDQTEVNPGSNGSQGDEIKQKKNIKKSLHWGSTHPCKAIFYIYQLVPYAVPRLVGHRDLLVTSESLRACSAGPLRGSCR
ncbi:hypothetical protein B566_EDAN013944, partial [Ephemera danica]